MFIVERRKDFARREEFERALKQNRETLNGLMLYESMMGQSTQTARLTAELDEMVVFYTGVLYGHDPNRLER